MERIRNLGLYQKVILLLMFIMLLAFTALYFITVNRVGFAYNNVILVPKQENEAMIYSGEIQGKSASFIVTADKVIEFQYGDKVYGPYTIKEDSTAIPKDSDINDNMTGIELYCENEVIFRGAVCNQGNFLWIYNEDGSIASVDSYAITSNMLDANGNVIDTIEPSAATIIDLMAGPELTHKGTWMGWFCGVFICFITIITILFADELFRLSLAFKVRDIDQVEPSDWEITSRYISWTVLSIMTLIIFIMGLQ